MPRPAAGTVFRRLADDEWAVYDPTAGRIHTLNLSAALVWEHCDGAHAVEDVVAAVGASFGASPGVVHGDVQRLIEWFVAQGLMAWT